MSAWQEFLKYVDQLRGVEPEKTPGPVMFSFVNRYLEPMDSIKYRIQYDGKTVAGVTSKERHTVEIQPVSLRPIKVYAWSRVRRDFKLIDEVTPVLGRRLLINERMKTYKHRSKTQLHPKPQPLASPTKAKPAAPSQQTRPAVSNDQPQGVEPVRTKNQKAEPEHQTNRPATDTIQVAQLKKIFPAADDAYLGKVAAELNTDLAKYKLETPLRRAHFFAQVRQEAGAELSPREESLNYRPSVLKEKFSYYKKHPDEAEQDGRIEEFQVVDKTIQGKIKKIKKKVVIQKANQEQIANKAYANREGNKSIASGDGWKFRGRGIFQLTLRSNYEAFDADYSKYWSDKKPNIKDNPDVVVDFPYFIRSAVWFWIRNDVYSRADRGSSDSAVDLVTERVNGPAKDAADKRRKNFHDLTYPAFK